MNVPSRLVAFCTTIAPGVGVGTPVGSHQLGDPKREPSTTDVATPCPAGRVSARSTTTAAVLKVLIDALCRPSGSPSTSATSMRTVSSESIVNVTGASSGASFGRQEDDIDVDRLRRRVEDRVPLVDPGAGFPVGEEPLITDGWRPEHHGVPEPATAVERLRLRRDHPAAPGLDGDRQLFLVAGERSRDVDRADRPRRHHVPLQLGRVGQSRCGDERDVHDGTVRVGVREQERVGDAIDAHTIGEVPLRRRVVAARRERDARRRSAPLLDRGARPLELDDHAGRHRCGAHHVVERDHDPTPGGDVERDRQRRAVGREHGELSGDTRIGQVGDDDLGTSVVTFEQSHRRSRTCC